MAPPPAAPAGLDELLGTLDVRFVSLTECVVQSGQGLVMGGADSPGLHYNLLGRGRMAVAGLPAFDLVPHTLVVVPPRSPFRIDAAPHAVAQPVDGRRQRGDGGEIRRVVAGDGEPGLLMTCGFFHATYGSAADLFGGLAAPIVEQFDGTDRMDATLKEALSELVAQEVGAATMSAALLKRVIVALLRRSLRTMSSWTEQFSALRDPQIARALAEMASHPGAPHTVDSLGRVACLGRSAFMARFVGAVGRSPMAVLRDLRMRQAAAQLRAGRIGVEQVARDVGYESRSSFARAFRAAYGTDPSDYRNARGDA